MIIVGQEKPSLEELSLQHFGVKGMHWGVKRGVGPEIRRARRSVMADKVALRDQKRVISGTKRGSAERTKAKKKFADMKVNALNNPDRAMAVRLTRGEKAALLLFNSTNPVSFAGAVGAIAGTAIESRVIAKRQQSRLAKK